MDEKSSDVAYRISLLMREIKLTQVQLSQTTNISTTAINNYCRGNRLPDTMCMYKIANALHTTMEWLLTGEGSKHSKRDDGVAQSIWELQEYQRQAIEDHYNNLTPDQALLLDNYEKLTLPNRQEIQGIIQLKLVNQLGSQIEGRAKGDTA